LNSANSELKQKIAALQQETGFKDGKAPLEILSVSLVSFALLLIFIQILDSVGGCLFA
jgi:hypothetical protein